MLPVPSPREKAIKLVLLCFLTFCAILSLVLYNPPSLYQQELLEILADSQTPVLGNNLTQWELQFDEIAAEDATNFTTTWLDVELGGEVDGTLLADHCERADFRTDVVLELNHAAGGIGNVRSHILDFLWFAVHTRSHIILPTYIMRSKADLLDYENTKNGVLPFDFYFDIEHFYNIMDAHCPQMRLYRSRDEIDKPRVLAKAFSPLRSRPDKNPQEMLGKQIGSFAPWLGSQADYRPREQQVVIVERTLWVYDLATTPTWRQTFGKLLKIRQDIRRLAATAIFNMRMQYNLTEEIDPSKTIYPAAYYGAHMRTEADADKVGWLSKYGDFEAQSNCHIELASEAGLEFMYVASGKVEDVVRLAEKAQDQAQITVVTKFDLLSGQDLDELTSLTWDQQALVDWEILARSSYFAGPSFSSFTWGIVTRRHVFLAEDPRYKEASDTIQETDHVAIYEDGMSRVLFRTILMSAFDMEYLAPRGMFP